MHDSDNQGAFPIQPSEAKRWNAEGYGIFWTVNEFNGPRQIKNLVRINSWAIDMDTGEKPDQIRRILSSPVTPSGVVETKRGFQVYWTAKDAKPEHWNSILIDRLVPFFGADANARDLARILRVPGFDHLKDPANPFRVCIREMSYSSGAITEQQMAERFPDSAQAKRDAETHARAKREHTFAGDSFWDCVYALDCLEGLARLSGHHAVGGQRFTFRRNGNGSSNILVDGRGSSAWVDKSGRIGSLSKGGPTLFQWLTHSDYGNSPKQAVDVIKNLYPQLADK
jgi:hypothetical protein